MKIFYLAIMFLVGVTPALAVNANVSIDYSSVIKTLPDAMWGFNNHLDYQAYPTWLDNDSSGSAEQLSNVTWHREKGVAAGVELWRGDTRLSSKYAGLNQGVLDTTYVTYNKPTGVPYNISINSSVIHGWDFYYQDVKYDLIVEAVDFEDSFSWYVDNITSSDPLDAPGAKALFVRVNSDIYTGPGFGKAVFTQTVSGTANNGSAFDIHVTTTKSYGLGATIVTDATCLNNYSTAIGSLGWYRNTLGNCTKAAGSSVNVSIVVPGFLSASHEMWIGGVRMVYSSTQDTFIGWRTDTLNNFANIDSDKNMLEYAYNETLAGRTTKVDLTLFHMPDEIAKKHTGYCDSDSRGCSYSDEKSFSDTVQSYFYYVTNAGQYCSIINYFEVWNEPDLTEYWLDDLSTGNSYRWEEYNRMYSVAWNAAKTSICGSNLRVGGPGLASIVSSDGSAFANSFLGNFTPSDMIDVLSWHRYQTGNISDVSSSAVSLEGTINTTRTLLSTYSVNTSNVCVSIGELNENNQNMVQNYSRETYSSISSMMAEVATDPMCLNLAFYQWADDSPWGSTTAEGYSSGIRRIAVQEPINGGEQLYSLYNATKDFYNNASGGSVIYNSTDNESALRVVPLENNLTKRFGIVNAKNETSSITVNIANISASNIIASNGTIYNLTGTSIRTATISGIGAYETLWYTINTTSITAGNGTCFSTNYVNYCLNTDIYLYYNITVNNDTVEFDQYVLNLTTSSGYINVTINSFDIYGNNNMTMQSLSGGNVVLVKIYDDTTNYTSVYGGVPYAYSNSFTASTIPTNFYYTSASLVNNEWFVNATNDITGNIVPRWNLTSEGISHVTNNGSIKFNGLHDSSGNGRTLTKGDCYVASNYLDCYDPVNNVVIDETNDLLDTNTTWSIGLWYQSYSISPNGTPDTILFLSRDNGATGNNSALTIRTQNSSRLVLSFRNGSNTTETFDIASVSTGKWNHVTVTYNGSNLKAYFNGINTVNVNRSFHGFGSNNATIAGLGDGEKFTGSITQIAFYNRTITSTEANNLLANTTPPYSGLRAYYPVKIFGAGTAVANATSYGYSGVSGTYSTTTPKTFVLGQLYTALNFSVQELVSENTLSNYVLTISGPDSYTYTVNNTYIIANLSYGEYTYTVNKSTYYVQNGSFTAENNTQNHSHEGLHNFYLNITFTNSILNTNETSFNASAYSELYNVTITSSTTNGTSVIPWISLLNTTITAYDGANTSRTNLSTRTSNVTGPAIINYRITGLLAQSVYFSFFDETTQQRLNGTNVTVYITSSSYTYNFTEESGNRTLDDVAAGSYVVTAEALGYVSRTYNFVLEDQGTAQQVIYLLNNDTGTYIRFTVLDNSYNVLQEATINALRKNISGTNYYEVGDCTTDNNGECIINLQTLTATYRFIACYQTTCYTTPDTTLSRDTYPIVINIGSSGLDALFQDSNIQTGLTYTNGSFTYTVIDTTNNVRTSYVTISRVNGGREIPLQTISGSGSSISLTSTYENSSIGNGIIARGYTVLDGQPVLTSILTAVPNSLGSGRNASLILLFVGLSLTVIFIFSWNPIAPPIIFGVMMMIFQRIGLIQVGVETLAAAFIIIGIAIFRMRNV